MNNLLSYCGLVDAKIRASDKDLTVRIPITELPTFEKKSKQTDLNDTTEQLSFPINYLT